MSETMDCDSLSMPQFEAETDSPGVASLSPSFEDQLSAEMKDAADRVRTMRYLFAKRALDLCGASLVSILLFPVAVAIAVGIRLASEGPIFYGEQRVGRHGRPFTIFKFRTMYTREYLERKFGMNFTPEQLAALRTHGKNSGDPRIFPLGKAVRALSLDELPQLINVLRGDMSLVGPRPVVRGERDQFGFYGGSFYDLALPGITGLWQVSGRSDLSFDQRVRLDTQYAREWGISLDLWILLRTLPAVFTRRGAY